MFGLQVVPRILLLWLCDENMKKEARENKYVASARLNMATGEGSHTIHILSLRNIEPVSRSSIEPSRCGRNAKTLLPHRGGHCQQRSAVVVQPLRAEPGPLGLVHEDALAIFPTGFYRASFIVRRAFCAVVSASGAMNSSYTPAVVSFRISMPQDAVHT